MSITDYGFDYEMSADKNAGVPARVTAVHKGRFCVVSDYGEGYAQLKGKEYYYSDAVFPTVGDFVLIDFNSDGDSRIIKTLKRKTYFSRRDPDKGKGEQAVAANFDYVFIMQSLNHNFNLKRLERYLTCARQSGAEPVIVLTKADLTNDPMPYVLEAGSVAKDVKICVISAKTGSGTQELAPYLQKGKTLVFLGSSGVGKSSLVNALAGEEIMDVNGIREADSKGRHTTTHRELIMLKNGAMIIDTPGMRELGVWEVDDGLADAFSDVDELAARCRFRDCKHKNEPGCAVREAIQNGELSLSRFESYLKLKTEAKQSGSASELRRKKEQKFKNIAVSKRRNRKDV